MKFTEQEIVLYPRTPFGDAVPLPISSALLRRLEATAKPCVRMALEGTSSQAGATPGWLERAIDIRTLGFTARGETTILHLQAPTLGEAAPKLFEQQSLFPNNASPGETALQIISRITREVRREDRSSDLYDRRLLHKFSLWKGLLEGDLPRLDLPPFAEGDDLAIPLDAGIAASAEALGRETPSPRQIRIVGKLDMVRHSTRSFELLLASGDAVRGVLVDGSPDSLQKHFGREITILGKAVYRPSGGVLRVDASEILDTSEGRDLFSSVPLPFAHAERRPRVLQTAKPSVSVFFGTWPGEETDEELQGALAELRG